MIYVWDEIMKETRPIDYGPMEASDELALANGLAPASVGLYCEATGIFAGKDGPGWKADHVIDLPDGTRIVIENDDRAHTAVLITTPEGD